MARPARLLGALTLGALWLCSALPLAVSVARAEPGPQYEPPVDQASEPALPESLAACADAPEPYEGEDEATGELRRLRSDLSQSCKALTARLGLLRERLWWNVLEDLVAHGDDAQAVQLVGALLEQAEAPLQVHSSGEPLEVRDSALVAGTEGVTASVDASGESLRGAIWYLVGALAAGVAGLLIYRQVMPRG